MASIELPDENAVLVVPADLRAGDDDVARAAELLDARERERAARFVFALHRRRYIVGHAAVRRIVGECAGLPPQDVVFRVGAAGKPSVEGSAIELNFSHADDVLVCAVARSPVGIDVEVLHAIAEADSMVVTIGTPEERAAIRRMPAGEARDAAFLALWTGKESVVKAIGAGLSFDVRGIHVPPAREDGWTPVARTGDGAHDGRWAIRRVPIDGCVCTLAMGAGRDLRVLRGEMSSA